MSTPYLSEIKILSFGFAPKGWALCNGQLLPINQNQALFALLGTTYGGNGTSTFALPNLQGNAQVHVDGQFPLGQAGGEAFHALNLTEIPSHTHAYSATSDAATTAIPTGGTPATASATVGLVYAAGPPTTPMGPTAVSPAGGSQPHQNQQPYLVLNFCIALTGIFPSRN
jgi:microcystin-dependent protein